MRLIVDTHLPPALAQLLITSGHHAEHVLDLNIGQAKDRAIWDYAIIKTAVIVSKNEDFINLHLMHGAGPQILWVRCGNLRRKVLLELFSAALPKIAAALANGEPIVEIS